MPFFCRENKQPFIVKISLNVIMFAALIKKNLTYCFNIYITYEST
jgi:hypothetical protein